MTESNAAFSKRVRPQVSQYETTLIEALDRLEAAEAECEWLRKENERWVPRADPRVLSLISKPGANSDD